MKTLLLLLVCLPSYCNARDIYSAAWLKRGCTAAMVLIGDQRNFTKDQEKTFGEVIPWIQGFLSGINSMSMAYEGAAKESFYDFPDEWQSPKTVAPLILRFMSDNEAKIPPNVPAMRVMMAWYYSSHPRANGHQRVVGDVILDALNETDAIETGAIPKAVPVKGRK
jgi:hypothetical protein